MKDEILKIGNPLKVFMEHKGWKLTKFIGNQYQSGIPDYYAVHGNFSPRWIETKICGRPLTKAQKRLFPIWLSCNVPIWIIDGIDFRETEGLPALKRAYDKLFQPSNAALYLIPKMRRFI